MGVTDEEILKNYANDYCEVLNAYNHKLIFSYEMKKEHAFVLMNGFTFAMLKIEINGMDKHITSMTNFGGYFEDNAPFEQKKEVSCED